jgi:hypothetical protein
VNDRIRAKPPATDADRWTETTVRAVRCDGDGGRYVVTVDDGTEVRVTEAVFELFAGRLDRSVGSPEDAVGATAWYR